MTDPELVAENLVHQVPIAEPWNRLDREEILRRLVPAKVPLAERAEAIAAAAFDPVEVD